jgi:hypothetical protein
LKKSWRENRLKRIETKDITMAKDSKDPTDLLPDTLTQRIGVLNRREVEARILSPMISALGDRFGREEVLDIIKDTIVKIAKEQGDDLAQVMGGCGSSEFLASLEYWKKDGALAIEVLNDQEGHLDFNVIRCRYAEMYRALGIPELGSMLSCNRDFALIEGFNQAAQLQRTQTIMQGAPHCDFRYVFPDE